MIRDVTMEKPNLSYAARAGQSSDCCRSAPTISLQVDEEDSVEIDLNSGLPRLPVELPQDWGMEPPEHDFSGNLKLVVLNSLDMKREVNFMSFVSLYSHVVFAITVLKLTV